MTSQRNSFFGRVVCPELTGIVLLCTLFLCGIRMDAQARITMKPFSADQIHTMRGKTTTGKVYANESAMRIEAEEKGKKSVTIMRLDRNVMWILMPEQRMYLEMGSFGAGLGELASSIQGAKTEREPLGSQQVGSYHCDKYRVRVTYEGKLYTSLEWDAKELDGFPVKRQGENGDWTTEYQNVHLGPQDASLFEIPAGYKDEHGRNPEARQMKVLSLTAVESGGSHENQGIAICICTITCSPRASLLCRRAKTQTAAEGSTPAGSQTARRAKSSKPPIRS